MTHPPHVKTPPAKTLPAIAPPRPTLWAALILALALSGLWLAGLGMWRLMLTN